MNTLNVKVILHLAQMSKKPLSIDRQKPQTLNKKQFLYRLYCIVCTYLWQYGLWSLQAGGTKIFA